MGSTQKQIDDKEQQLKAHYAELANLKTELQNERSRWVRSLIKKDIRWCENTIRICELKIEKMKKQLAR